MKIHCVYQGKYKDGAFERHDPLYCMELFPSCHRIAKLGRISPNFRHLRIHSSAKEKQKRIHKWVCFYHNSMEKEEKNGSKSFLDISVVLAENSVHRNYPKHPFSYRIFLIFQSIFYLLQRGRPQSLAFQWLLLDPCAVRPVLPTINTPI